MIAIIWIAAAVAGLSAPTASAEGQVLVSAILIDVNAKGGPGAGFSPI